MTIPARGNETLSVPARACGKTATVVLHVGRTGTPALPPMWLPRKRRLLHKPMGPPSFCQLMPTQSVFGPRIDRHHPASSQPRGERWRFSPEGWNQNAKGPGRAPIRVLGPARVAVTY
jgi:hypothetical protein